MSRVYQIAMAVTGMLVAICPRASALNPSLDISQYAHTAWTVRDGFLISEIYSMAQTPDGYLWLGTPFGVYRFDGVRTVPLPLAAGTARVSRAGRLLGARDGTLWISRNPGLASWKSGNLTEYPEFADAYILGLAEDSQNKIWIGVSAPSGRLCVLENGHVACSDAGGKLTAGVVSLLEDARGSLWAGLVDGVVRWKPGAPQFFSLPRHFPLIPRQSDGYVALAEENGALLIPSPDGIARLVNGKVALVYPSSPSMRAFSARAVLRDREGGVWIGTSGGGLARVHQGRTDLFTQADGLSGDYVTALLEDPEGNIWVGTTSGLDRFHHDIVPTYRVAQGLSNDGVTAVLVARDGTVWIGTRDGLNRWERGQVTSYRPHPVSTRPGVREIVGRGLPEHGVKALFQDSRGRIWITDQRGAGYLEDNHLVSIPGITDPNIVWIAEDRQGDLWIAGTETLAHMRNDRVIEQIPWSTIGTRGTASAGTVDPGRSGIWLGFERSIAYFDAGRVQDLTSASNRINGLRVDRDGAVWAATDNGLSRAKNGRIDTLNASNGLPCDVVHWSIEDDVGSLWLWMPCGLVRVPRSDIDAWAVAVERNEPANPAMRFTVFDNTNGLRTTSSAAGYQPQVGKSADGKLWFATYNGVAVIDPGHLPVNTLAPPVHVEQVTADRKSYDPASGLRLPPLSRDLEIDYTALSFVAPERNRLRIKLDGWDREWQDVGNRRQAFYTNLPPRHYTFRVMASNNSGVWNETGAALEFSIAPAYYQTRWFAALVVVATAMLLWTAYQLRVAQLARQFSRTLDARVSERTRIARDLHDTLLQSFHGALLRFQAAANVVKTRPDEASERLQKALDLAEAAITEGRNAVQGLRASATTLNDLVNGIAAIGAELTSDPAVVDAPAISVDVLAGPSRDLNPVVRDEAYRIAGEALRNAFNHAHARHVVVTIHYESRQFRLIVRDDGKGIDAETMERQQAVGHFGLPGMRERATIVKGRLDVRSAPGAGTEIELRVPAAIAYAAAGGRSRWSRLFGR